MYLKYYLFANFFYTCRQAFKMRQTEEQRKLEEMRRQKEEEMLQKRQEYVEKTKNALVFGEMPSEKPGRKGKKVRTDQYVSDSGGSGRDEGREEMSRERKRKKKPSGETKERKSRGKGRRKKDIGSGESGEKNLFFILSFYKIFFIIKFNFCKHLVGSESDQPKRKRVKKNAGKKEKSKGKGAIETLKGKLVKSKETISTSESDSDTGGLKIASG